jgi:hypothetical protein
MSAGHSVYAAAGDRSWAQREADASEAMRLLMEVAEGVGRRKVLDALGIERPVSDWRRTVHHIRVEAALWRAQRVIAACDGLDR